MSLLNHISIAKNKHMNINPITNATFYTINTEQTETLYLDINSIFKSIKIYYSGRIDIIKSNYDGVYINSYNNIIDIMNYSKFNLIDNVLFEYYGRNVKFNKFIVYNWSNNSIIANEQLYETKKINDSKAVFDTSTLTFKDDEIKIPSNIVEFEERELNNSNVLGNLYTTGTKFTLESEEYIGDYHFHIKENVYMTGKYHTDESMVLKQL